MTEIVGFTGSQLDRADRERENPEALAAARSDWRARLLRLNGLDPQLDDAGQLAWTSLADLRDGEEPLFLGYLNNKPHFVPLDMSQRHGAVRSPALFSMLNIMTPDQASLYACARSLVDWHQRSGFCGACGSTTEIFRGGWGRKCSGCGAEHFPRTDPVVIMLAEYEGRVLLGRQPSFPPGRYSALAGFVEVGESIEEAVMREVREEAGLTLTNVRYVASQPWPFASSLMIACIGQASDDQVTLDSNELEDAIWVTREQARAAMAGEEGALFLAPPHYAIAYSLLREWINA